MESETLEALQARHRKEQRDLVSRITSKKKNATKKTRKGINDECAALERDLKERQERELAALNGDSIPAEEPAVPDETDAITEKLEKTTVEDTTPAMSAPTTATTTSQPAETQQPGKKRNRQKERLARRAAEQIASAEAAEKEAKTMPDYRSLERTSLERAFETHGLVEHEIRPDGHCLFSAIADQLSQRGIPLSSRSAKAEPYRIVRKVATDYMEKHADDFAPFLEEPLATYVPKIRDTAEWGGQLELLALASAYGVEIRVVQNGRMETIQPQGSQEGKERTTIWLAYYRHGFGLGEHYNSLRTKG